LFKGTSLQHVGVEDLAFGKGKGRVVWPGNLATLILSAYKKQCNSYNHVIDMLTGSNGTKLYFLTVSVQFHSSFLAKMLISEFYLCAFGPIRIIGAGEHCKALLKVLSTSYASFYNFNLHWFWSQRHPFMGKALQQQMTSIGNQYCSLTFL